MESDKTVSGNYYDENSDIPRHIWDNMLKKVDPNRAPFANNWPIENLLNKDQNNNSDICARLDRIEKKLDILLGSKPVLINGIWR